MNIIVTGFMGTGKTTLGRALAKRLEMDFIDTDMLIENKLNLSVSEIFEKFGEKYFRVLEREVVKELKEENNTVIATGGKTLLYKKNLKTLTKNGILLTLHSDPEDLWERVKKYDSRPLLKGITKDEFIKLYLKRAPLYENLPNKIKISNFSETEAETILEFLTKELMRIEIKIGDKISEVILKRSLPGEIEKYIFSEKKGKVFMICDSKVFGIHGETLKKICQSFYIISGKDRNKNLKNAERLWKWLIKENVKRDSILLSFGGGVIGDLCGFVSSTILRGISHYHVPTTLLSMLDSSIGGKNGINLLSMKNAVGTINPPDKVFVDPTLLFSLPRKEISSGLVEAIKAGFIGDPLIFDLIEKRLHLIENIDLESLEEVISRSIKVKKTIVEKDPFEKNIRKFLNLGHTLAHALESFHRYRISHGEAVGLGLIYSLELSEMLGLCSKDLKARLKFLLNELGLKTRIKGNKENLIDLMKMDKKSTEEGIDFVLLKGWGEPVLKRGISKKILLEALEEVLDENTYN